MIESISRDIKIYRDDLFPYFGGGNKGRKMISIVDDIKLNGYNAIVTTGGIQSNHNRATVFAAAQNKWLCTLIIHGDKHRLQKESGNAKIIRHSNAEIMLVDSASDIGAAMDEAMEKYTKAGMKPYYLTGGGHVMSGGKAYIDAIEDLKKYCNEGNWQPDYIFLASGTGSTQAGIMAGLDNCGFDKTAVIGISVARQRDRAETIVNDFYSELCSYYKIKNSGRKTVVLDDYLCGGYEKYNFELKQLSEDSIKNYGFILDVTYSGKAFYGMLETIRKNNLENKNILFWHTGGVLNFLK